MSSNKNNQTSTEALAAPDWLTRLNSGQTVSYRAGQTICLPEASDNWFFVISSGSARIFLNGGSKNLTISYLRPGGIYVSHTRAWVEAIEACTIVRWPLQNFISQVSHEPEFAIAALTEIGRVIGGAFNIIEDLAFRPVEARLARLLLSEMRIQGGPCIRLIERSERLATALGTSRQTLSMLLNQMARDGVIERDGREIVILCDIVRLQSLENMSSS